VQRAYLFIAVLEKVLILRGVGLVGHRLEFAALDEAPVYILEKPVLLHVGQADAEVRVAYEDLLKEVPSRLVAIPRHLNLALADLLVDCRRVVAPLKWQRSIFKLYI